MRIFLDSSDYDRNAESYKKHLKTYCAQALQGKDIRTFAATCDKVGKWPTDPVFYPFGLVLVDEAAAVAEPDIIQPLNVFLWQEGLLKAF